MNYEDLNVSVYFDEDKDSWIVEADENIEIKVDAVEFCDWKEDSAPILEKLISKKKEGQGIITLNNYSDDILFALVDKWTLEYIYRAFNNKKI